MKMGLTPSERDLLFKACVKAQGGFMQFIYDEPYKYETLNSQAMYKSIVIEDALIAFIEFRADQLSRRIDIESARRIERMNRNNDIAVKYGRDYQENFLDNLLAFVSGGYKIGKPEKTFAMPDNETIQFAFTRN